MKAIILLSIEYRKTPEKQVDFPVVSVGSIANYAWQQRESNPEIEKFRGVSRWNPLRRGAVHSFHLVIEGEGNSPAVVLLL